MSGPVPNQPPPINYGGPVTQRGVTAYEDAEVLRITIPQQGLVVRWCRRVLPARLLSLLNDRPRAVVELAGGTLSIREQDEDLSITRTWPADRIAECRPNRYQRSLYVRVPGESVDDALMNLDQDLIEFVATTLRPRLAVLRDARGPGGETSG